MTLKSRHLDVDSLLSQPPQEKKALVADDAVTAVLRAALAADSFADMQAFSAVPKDLAVPVVEVRDVDAETKDSCPPTVVVQPFSGTAEYN
eukprot:950994-Amphidinium_carterae.1